MEPYKLGEMEGKLAELIWKTCTGNDSEFGGTVCRCVRLETDHNVYYAEAALRPWDF